MMGQPGSTSQGIATQVAPESLISSNGEPCLGHFDGPVETLGLELFDYFTEMDKPASSLKKYFHYKQFQFVSLITPYYVIGIAIADIRYLGSAFCYLYDINKDQIVETKWVMPLGLGYQLSPSPMTGLAQIGSRTNRIAFQIENGCWRVQLSTKQVQADLELKAPTLSLPMAMCNPTGYSGWTYTQKHNGLKPAGKLSVYGEEQNLNRALAGYDFSAGFMRPETSWRWASISAHLAEGVIGLNLAAGVNETGVNENVFWVNGEKHLLGPVHFKFDRERGKVSSPVPHSQWRIYSDNGQIELNFTPQNCRQEKLNLLLLKSNFRQYIGYYTGYIIDNSGHKHQLDNVMGLTEDHFARW